ncbi:hypothetical protein SNOG_07662 [Parastagonospora nodorum SN15]|uniref:Uncharacterized protein n=1 Tax=Phaeosphaeria nodorum (strain SN15 / ATCC MYA-4574 / FGSC 10173) TaxID=321614 RepID=Q0UKQ2_PHANO|nr:hypothetical protein SNOG_07662 [Parastagonospora nodorum SN15]EAT85128.1 hypothetical protein SNOG_07662 [Parastagonospora nodorum SN15]
MAMGHINQHVCERILGDLKDAGVIQERRSQRRDACFDASAPRENWALYSSPVVCCAASCCTGNIEYYNQSNSLESSRSYPYLLPL